MPVTVSGETSSGRQPNLWGVGNVTQSLEVAPQRQPPMLLWEQRWIKSLVWLETLNIAFKQRLLASSSLSSLTEEIVELSKQLIELKIHVPAPNDVWQYFERYPHLIRTTRDLAELACERLPNAVLSLEISRDPEEDEDYIVLYARFDSYDETTINRIRVVRKEFLSRLGDEREWPLLTTDFSRP